MASGVTCFDAFILLLLLCSATALVGPTTSSTLRLSGNRRGAVIAFPCLQNCSCSSNAIRCEYLTLNQDDWRVFDFPRNTQQVSIKYLLDKNFNGTVLSGLELRWLRLNNGQLLTYPSLPSLPSLVYMDISENALASLASNQFINTPNIIHLNLSGNSFSNISSSALEALTNLKELDLSRNPSLNQLPDSIFVQQRELRYLDLSDTGLSAFSYEWSASLQNLVFLNLSHNNIKYLPPNLSLRKLQVLDLSHNPLLELPRLAGFPYLSTLLASHTIISYIRVSETKGCERLTTLDLSYSSLRNLNDDVLGHCKELRELNVSHNFHLWRIEHRTFSGLGNLQVLRLNNCPKLYDVQVDAFNGLEGLRELHMENSGVQVLPYFLSQISNLTYLNLEGTSLLCDCHSHWIPEFLLSSKNTWKGVDTIHCNDNVDRTPQDLIIHLQEIECSPVEMHTPADEWTLAPWGESTVLECNVSGNPTPKVVWQTVDQHLHVFQQSIKETPWVSHQISVALSAAEVNSAGKFQVLESGHLLIANIKRQDIGRYKCFAFNPVSNSSVVHFLGIDDSAFRALIIESILFGFACAALFLIINLVVQLTYYIINRLELECCCCRNRLSPKAKQIRRLIESVESYKKAQLDKLKDNYNGQVVSIKDSCYQQMEKLRESYAQQSKNLKDLCDYSTQQFTGARDQYLDQVNKVRDYSMGQMNRVRENYVFQRHRIRKFSGHQLLKLRETYKYQQKTLNKLMETLPDLYIQNCRTGSCQRSDSIVFEDEIIGLDIYYKVDFLLDGQSICSDYYTPNSTLTRHSKGAKLSHSRNPSSASGGTEYQEARSNLTRQESSGSDKGPDYKAGVNQGFHNRSFSISTTPTGIHRFVESHKRSISASSHPSPQSFRPKPPLMEEGGSEAVSLASKSDQSKTVPPSPEAVCLTSNQSKSTPPSPVTRTLTNTTSPLPVTPIHTPNSNSLSSTTPIHANTLLSVSPTKSTPLYTPFNLTPVHDTNKLFTDACQNDEDQKNERLGLDLVLEAQSNEENCDNEAKDIVNNSEVIRHSRPNSETKVSYETSL